MARYISSKGMSVVIEPRDGPPVKLATTSVYLTDAGNRVAFVEYAPDADAPVAIKRGQVVRLVIEEGEGGETHVLESATIDVASRNCQACHAVRSVIVVVESGTAKG